MPTALRSDTSPAENRRERRKAETRSRLLNAARHLFVERGYEATRPQDIARAADLATGTFYVHFADKSEAFQAFSDQVGQELMGRIAAHESRRPADEGLIERIPVAIGAVCEFAMEQPGTLRAAFADDGVISTIRNRKATLRYLLPEYVARRLRGAALRGEIRNDYDPFLIGHGIVGLVQQVICSSQRREIDPHALADNLSRFCCRALAPDDEIDEGDCR